MVAVMMEQRTGILVGALLLGVIAVAIFLFPPAPVEEADMSVEPVAENLDIPWEIVFLPEGDILVTERPGTLIRIDDGQQYTVDGVRHIGEGGLLGMALHPEFAENNHLYLYMTTQTDDGLRNRVVRYTLQNDQLTNPEVIIDEIPGARYHDGGRIAFGPDGMLYITTGDSSRRELAQDRDSLAGKILRLNPDGSVPADNPFDTPVYSYGHRNPQGLTWDDRGNLWATEHGDRGRDELNLIRSGQNYGWPVIDGDETRDGMVTPVVQSGASTWAPAGAAYVSGHVVFAGLRGRSLYVADLSGNDIATFERVPMGDYGRLRAVTVGLDNMLYLSTSNTDGRGNPQQGDDKVLRVDPGELVDR